MSLVDHFSTCFAASTDYTITLTTDGYDGKISNVLFYMGVRRRHPSETSVKYPDHAYNSSQQHDVHQNRCSGRSFRFVCGQGNNR